MLASNPVPTLNQQKPIWESSRFTQTSSHSSTGPATPPPMMSARLGLTVIAYLDKIIISIIERYCL